MGIMIKPFIFVLLLIANGALVANALACSPLPPSRPIVEIAPETLLSAYREAYGNAGFKYDNEVSFDNQIQLHFRFALSQFPGKENGKLSIAFDLGSGANCNPCKVYLVQMNVGTDYSPREYNVAQKLINQMHNQAESQLARRLGNKIRPTPKVPSCPGS